jgi:hypothetical protein
VNAPRWSRRLPVFLIGLLAAAAILAPSASAAVVQLGGLAPPGSTGSCGQCSQLQLKTAPGSPSYVVPPGTWTLTSWSVRGGDEEGVVALRIYRPTGVPGQYRVLATTTVEPIPAGVVSVFPAAIPVQPGDTVGIETGLVPTGYPPNYKTSDTADVNGGVTGNPKDGQTAGPGGEYEIGEFHGYLINVAATLTGPTAGLTVTRSGGGSGTVTSTPAGIDCGTLCSASFDLGATVGLTATPAPGSTFAGWSGACSGTGPCQVSLAAAATVGAAFDVAVGPPPPPTPTCVIPKLKHLKLKAAKKKLRAAGCKVGHLGKRKGATAKDGRVVKEKPKPGTVEPDGAKVGVKLG